MKEPWHCERVSSISVRQEIKCTCCCQQKITVPALLHKNIKNWKRKEVFYIVTFGEFRKKQRHNLKISISENRETNKKTFTIFFQHENLVKDFLNVFKNFFFSFCIAYWSRVRQLFVLCNSTERKESIKTI